MKKILVCVMLLAMLSACGLKPENAANSAAGAATAGAATAGAAGDDSVKDFEREGETAHVRAEKIAESLKEMEELEHVSVVVTGGAAIVGIVVKGDISDGDLIDLKNVISARVKAFDKSIGHVAVSSAQDVFDKITNMNGGKPKAEEDELHRKFDGDKIFFRMTPSF
jgi:YhcN/YlaJ family sporulation lipoprotein